MKTLKTYILELQELAAEHGDLPLYTADDAEGNGYTSVYYSPGVVYAEQLDHRLDSVYCDDEIEEIQEDLGRPLIPILLLN